MGNDSKLSSAASIAPSAAGFMGSAPSGIPCTAGMADRRIPWNNLSCNMRITQHITLLPITKACISPVCHVMTGCLSPFLLHGIIPLHLPAHASPTKGRHAQGQKKLIPANASFTSPLIPAHLPCVPILIILPFCNPFFIPEPSILKHLTGTLGIILVFHIRNAMIQHGFYPLVCQEPDHLTTGRDIQLPVIHIRKRTPL